MIQCTTLKETKIMHLSCLNLDHPVEEEILVAFVCLSLFQASANSSRA